MIQKVPRYSARYLPVSAIKIFVHIKIFPKYYRIIRIYRKIVKNRRRFEKYTGIESFGEKNNFGFHIVPKGCPGFQNTRRSF